MTGMTKIGVRKRHNLRSRGCPRSVQDKSGFIRFRETLMTRRRLDIGRKGKRSSLPVRRGDELNDRYLMLLCHVSGKGMHPRVDDKCPRLQFGHIEVEFISSVGWVKGSACSTGSYCDKADRHLRSIGKHNRHPVISLQ